MQQVEAKESGQVEYNTDKYNTISISIGEVNPTRKGDKDNNITSRLIYEENYTYDWRKEKQSNQYK